MSTFIETSVSIITHEEPDLIRSESKPNAEVTRAGVLEDAEVVMQLSKGKPYYLIIVANETATYDKESREYIHKETEGLKKAEALVARSLAHRILGTFYARTRRKHHPIRLFATEWEAVVWIESLRDNEPTKGH
jgi:hypothetical protein